jgi:hypothetical protein
MSMKEFIPTGFVPLSDWDYKHRGSSDGHSVEWKLLGDAAKTGEIPGMKLGGSGRWFVHQESAVALLAKRFDEDAKRAAQADREAAAADAAVEAPESVAVDLARLTVAVDRLAAAIESVSKAGVLQGMCVNDLTIYEEGSST